MPGAEENPNERGLHPRVLSSRALMVHCANNSELPVNEHSKNVQQ
jgi:hypothetical protein